MCDFTVGYMLSATLQFTRVMIGPALVFGLMGFVFGLSAFDKVTKLEKRVRQLELPHEEQEEEDEEDR